MRFSSCTYHEPGIYFGLPEEDYHADGALGSTDLKNLLISPLQYFWYSRANPYRPKDASTPAMQYGRAIHKCVLEGRDAFDQRYCVKAPPPKPGALITVDDLRQHAEKLGLAKGGKKAELIARIRLVDTEVPIYEEEIEAHKAAHGNKIALDEGSYAEILLASHNITRNPHLKSAFVNGYPEVSVFFEMFGIPMRARFDYLKARAIVDLKSTRNAMGMPWDVAVANFLARGNYHIQATAYMLARQLLPKFAREGRVFGDHDQAWLKKVCEADTCSFVFVVYQAEGAPLVAGVEFTEDESDYALALMQLETAAQSYKDGFARFGDELWVEEGKIEKYANLPWPLWRT